jgi:hypothetical protein
VPANGPVRRRIEDVDLKRILARLAAAATDASRRIAADPIIQMELRTEASPNVARPVAR